MKSRIKSVRAVQAEREVQLSLSVPGVLRDIEHAFQGLCVSAGKAVLALMMEQDRESLCGPNNVPDAGRCAVRAGHSKSSVVMGGQRLRINKPRVRDLQTGEVALPSFAWAADTDPLDEATLVAMASRVSTRHYARTQPLLDEQDSAGSTGKSSVSRRWVALTEMQLQQWMNRTLQGMNLPVMMVDGIHFRDRVILVAMGIDHEGEKHVLGLREGSSENAGVAQSLLSELIERGLDTSTPRLWVIDGSKALRRAIKDTFGSLAQVQRCQEHKRRNVLDHLPKSMHPSVSRALRDAWSSSNAQLCKRRLQRLASSLKAQHPGAAASVLEGLDESTTAQELGVSGALYRTLRTTNPIENLNGLVAQFTSNVKRWRNGQMVLRWVSAALIDAQPRMRRIKGYKGMQGLIKALAKTSQPQAPSTRKVA